MSTAAIFKKHGHGRKMGPKEKKIADATDLIIITVFMTAFFTLCFWSIIIYYMF